MSGHRVVVCEDDPSTSLLLTKAIGTLPGDVKVVTFESVGKALLELQKNSTDLLILDHMMAGVNGLDGLKYIRKAEWGKALPVIVYSAADIEREAIAAGANRFLRKPLPIGEIRKAVREILGLDGD